jgi:hypothetical protein
MEKNNQPNLTSSDIQRFDDSNLWVLGMNINHPAGKWIISVFAFVTQHLKVHFILLGLLCIPAFVVIYFVLTGSNPFLLVLAFLNVLIASSTVFYKKDNTFNYVIMFRKLKYLLDTKKQNTHTAENTEYSEWVVDGDFVLYKDKMIKVITLTAPELSLKSQEAINSTMESIMSTVGSMICKFMFLSERRPNKTTDSHEFINALVYSNYSGSQGNMAIANKACEFVERNFVKTMTHSLFREDYIILLQPCFSDDVIALQEAEDTITEVAQEVIKSLSSGSIKSRIIANDELETTYSNLLTHNHLTQ